MFTASIFDHSYTYVCLFFLQILGKCHEDVEGTLNTRLEQAINVEMAKRNKYLEEELERLKKYVDLSKKETSMKLCRIM